MSNLHKDLSNDQIHNPKDFSTAANDTKLTKNSSGNLEWVADADGGVSQIIAGTNVTISPTGGTGAVTINSPISIVSTNIEGHGSITAGNEFGLGNAQYNQEHKFVVNLGASPITWVSPKNMVNSSVWVVPRDGARMLSFNGWLYGASGQIHLSLLRTKLACPLVGEYPSQLPICRLSTQLLTLTGNNTPICFNVTDFETCSGFDETMVANEVLMLSAYVPPEARDAVSFNLNCNIAMTY